MKTNIIKLFMLGILTVLMLSAVAVASGSVQSVDDRAPRKKPAPPPPPPDPEPDPEPAPELTGDGVVNKYAIIIGISAYKAISGLSFCDEDASDWYNYLAPLGYDIILLGDGVNTYPVAQDDYASEYNIKQAVANVLAIADGDDIVAFCSSGHGTEVKTGSGRTATYVQAICAWDCSAGEDGENGLLYDSEFATMWAGAATNVFIFLDHCFSGGMADFVSGAQFPIYMTTTCTDDGYGWDVPTFANGMWTYYFLESTMVGQNVADLHSAFVIAHADAVADGYDGGDEPCEFYNISFVL
jgi:hypothetical protein